MDCIQLLCSEAEEDSAPLRWHRHTEKCSREYSLKRLLVGGWFVGFFSRTFSLNRCQKCRWVGGLAAGQGLMNRWLEAAHVFHGCALSIAGLQILVQNGNYFIIQNLELANSLNHFLQRLQTAEKQTHGN